MSKIPPPRKLCAIIGIGLGILNPLFAQNKVDLGNLATKNANGIKYIAVGSSLSAGVRDGGVYAEAQQTSFPALLAQQMGIKEFKQPLLDGNGTGKKIAIMDKNGILKFTETPATYNDKKKETKLPKVNTEVDNLAVPYQKVFDLYEGDESNANGVYDNRSYRHLSRFSNDKKTLPALAENQKIKADFFTFEFGFHDFIQFALNGGYTTDISFMCEREFIGEKVFLDNITRTVPSGVLLNVPNYMRFPIFTLYSSTKAHSKLGVKDLYIQHWQESDVRLIDEKDILLPQGSVLDLFANGTTGKSIENPLKDKDVFDIEEQRFAGVQGYNRLLKVFAEQKQLPYVDLELLYNQILDGEYISTDGVTIDISYPSGNFFSADGITPTALGQAIITNEIIRVLNEHYNAKIPSLNLKNYTNL